MPEAFLVGYWTDSSNQGAFWIGHVISSPLESLLDSHAHLFISYRSNTTGLGKNAQWCNGKRTAKSVGQIRLPCQEPPSFFNLYQPICTQLTPFPTPRLPRYVPSWPPSLHHAYPDSQCHRFTLDWYFLCTKGSTYCLERERERDQSISSKGVSNPSTKDTSKVTTPHLPQRINSLRINSLSWYFQKALSSQN